MNNDRIQLTIIPREEPDIPLYILALIDMARAELDRDASPGTATPGTDARDSSAEPKDAA